MRLATEIQANDESHRLGAPTGKPDRKPPPLTTDENTVHSAKNGATESAKYSALVTRATNDAVRDWNVRTGQLAWPEGFDRLLGYESTADAQTIGFWQAQIHPQDRAAIAGSIRDALASDADHWTGEYRFRRADDSYADLLERATIVRDTHGAAVRFVGSLMDITARKQLQDQLCRSQKMEAFGQLAGGVAHDFNNFLTTILGYSDLLLHESGLKNTYAKHVGEIRSAAGRASMLTAQLLAFSRKHPLAPRVLEVNSIITNLERSLLRLLGENITVACHLHESREPVHIKVDSGEIGQVILNLAVNSRDAMPQGGQLSLTTNVETISADSELALGCEDLSPGDYVSITVGDSGHGMSDEAMQHLFEPFFTTKDQGRGSGLGLATSYGIVRQSGGGMVVQSERGRGTIVTMYLPKVAAPPAANYKKPGGKKLPVGTETILVLEDDVSVRHISVRVLRSLGYDVIEAANGDDAQRLIHARNGAKIHLLLTDMVMPQMSGRDFAAWLGTTSPHTKVVFVSGYLDESLQVGAAGGDVFFLPKPFDPEQLAGKIREALDAR
ncbi:MAG: ATP-binding protein [Verrucomicrobiota bacterium]|nr:ATP-binding protein [Verrucomicrobiota bacterium]